jgi:cation diffusion facilitator CzcD-associated flavoprotein CzcO
MLTIDMIPVAPKNPLHFDVLIIGAGLSGIGAAHHLQMRCPGRSYAILEGRSRIGGTWDLFRKDTMLLRFGKIADGVMAFT